MKIRSGILLASFFAVSAIAAPQMEKAKLSRSTPVLKAPLTAGTKMEAICESALKGTKVQILEKRDLFDVKVKIINGSCKNMVGWISSESVELL